MNFSAILCLKQAISKASLGKYIIVIVVAFAKNRCIIFDKIEFINTNFFISILARTDNIVIPLDRSANNIYLDLFLLFRVSSPPLTNIAQFNRKIVTVI